MEKRDEAKSGKRRGGIRSMAALLSGLTGRALGRRGFATASVITDWPVIVGPELAAQSQPDRLVFPRGARDRGTLHIRVDGPLATELMHLEPLVIERVNAHFGYAAVAQIRLHRAPLRRPSPKRPPKPPPPPPNLAERAALAKTLRHVDDPETRQILTRIGEGLLAREKARHRRQ